MLTLFNSTKSSSNVSKFKPNELVDFLEHNLALLLGTIHKVSIILVSFTYSFDPKAGLNRAEDKIHHSCSHQPVEITAKSRSGDQRNKQFLKGSSVCERQILLI